MARSPALAVICQMHFQDAAKYVTEIGQPAIFGIVEISKKWYDGLPADLQEIVDRGRCRRNGGDQFGW